MKIISYRGPNNSGGLSTAVGQAWSEYSHIDDLWFHIDQNHLQILSHACKPQQLMHFPQAVIEGHYRYCNEFLWPLMHDLGEHAAYIPEHQRQYKQLNAMISSAIAHPSLQSEFFIHDYHFALLPELFKQNNRSVIFWHIPWPEIINNWSHLSPLIDIAEGMLGAKSIGFHTQEYARRFMQFVERNLPRCICDWDKMLIKTFQYNRDGSRDFPSEKITELTVAPVGIDFSYWATLSKQNDNADLRLDLPYIFSVDRVDYTKGVDKRLQAIDCFFERFPQWCGKVNFIQACGRTRPGIAAFDKYWHECQQLEAKIEKKWRRPEWSPLVWLQPALSAAELAPIYKNAAVMLVNPVKDGLNLTAKEYIACQGAKPGVLALSRGAGAWHELGHYSMPVDPQQPQQMAETINKSLHISSNEKMLRMSLLSEKVQNNTLADWWYHMTKKLETKTEKQLSRGPLVSPGSKAR